jgi:hypothetical protein
MGVAMISLRKVSRVAAGFWAAETKQPRRQKVKSSLVGMRCKEIKAKHMSQHDFGQAAAFSLYVCVFIYLPWA